MVRMAPQRLKVHWPFVMPPTPLSNLMHFNISWCHAARQQIHTGVLKRGDKKRSTGNMHKASQQD